MISPAEQELITRLSRYTNNEKVTGGFTAYSPDAILQAKQQLGNPDRGFLSIHVAGTNGKGSVCHMLSGILSGSGYKTGLYTSPHLESVCERISINGRNISPEELLNIIDIIEMSLAGKNISLTWFDMMTLSALLYFSNSWVDAALIETGLGGRLDSTNIITPAASIITDISLDHRHILGDTVELIAEEKAGIIKKGIPCVTTNTQAAAVDVLRRHAEKLHAGLSIRDTDYRADDIHRTDKGILFSYRDDQETIEGIELPFKGLFQTSNAAAAIRTLRLLGASFPQITPDTIRSALRKAVVPGRMQVLSRDPLVIFDPAHNRQALASLCDTMLAGYRAEELVFFVSFMADKEPLALTELLRSRGIQQIIYCDLPDERGFHPEPGIFDLILNDSIAGIAEEIAKRNCISVFTGSFRLYSAASASARLLLDRAESDRIG
jgi:dihydrofolate synthase/folylpolyglutamate synthase